MENLPRRVVVKKTISSRYTSGVRPTSWDERRDGIEKVETTDGSLLSIYSSGGQSTPAEGWELLLTDIVKVPGQVSDEEAHAWTLYGIQSTVS